MKRYFAIQFLGLLFFLPLTVFGAVTVENSYGTSQAFGGTITVSTTVGNDNDVIVVSVGGNYGAEYVSDISCGGNALTKIVGSQPTYDAPDASVWYLLNPTLGTYDCVATLNNALRTSLMRVYVLAGADKMDLIDTSVINFADMTGSISTPVSSTLDGAFIFDIISRNVTSSPTVAGDQTVSFTTALGHGSSYLIAGTAGSSDMNWSYDSSVTGQAIAVINPCVDDCPGGGPPVEVTGVMGLISYAEMTYASSTGINFALVAHDIGNNFIKLFAGSGISMLYELRYWIVALIAIGILVYFAYRALNYKRI